ncbi:MAG: GIY-YIG nuclease family protein [Microgenomates group bacterium]
MIDFQKIKKLPCRPGVYLFKDKFDNVLYIGKALNLRKRVKNYFVKKDQENRIKNMIENAEKINFIETKSEIEALLLEAELIKKYQPKFNVRLKDDKRYLYAGISKETYSRVFLLRKPEIEKELDSWFGPFPSAQSIREILRLLRRIFPFRSCSKLPQKVCLYYHLNLCPGMCQYPISPQKYQRTINKIKLFLSGKVSFLLKKLEKEMKSESEKLNFEEAQIKKKQMEMIINFLGRFKKFPAEEEKEKALKRLRKIIVKYQGFDPVVIHRLEGYDIANLGEEIIVGSMVVFINGEPDNRLYRQFKIKTKLKGDPYFLKEIITRRLNHPEWLYPQLILIDGGKTQLSLVFEALKEKKLEGKIGLLGLVKGEEKIVVPLIKKGKIISWKKLSSKNEALFLLQQVRDEAHRFAQRYYKRVHQKTTFSSGQ